MTGVSLQPSGAMSLRVSASMMTLVLLALMLRAWARLKSHRKVLIEDVLIIFAAVLFYTDQGLFLYAVMGNGGSGSADVTKMTLPEVDRWLKYLYAEEMLFVIGITIVKLSILMFYRHIFTTRTFARINLVLIAITIVWCIITLFIVIFQCSPVHGVWNYAMQLYGQTTCLNSPRMIFGFEISNVIIDVSILIPPVFMVQKLQLSMVKRISLTVIFLLGLFVCITCAVRAHFIYDPSTGLARNLPVAMDWTTVEMASAIVCASLPTYGPIMSRAGTIFPSVKSWYISLRSSIQKDRTHRTPYGSDRQKHDGSAQTFDLQPRKYHAMEEDAATCRDSKDTSNNVV